VTDVELAELIVSKPYKPKKEFTGLVYGDWTVVSVDQDNPRKKLLCRCSCGVERSVFRTNLLSGNSISCGHATRRGHVFKYGLETSKHPEYRVWQQIIHRCTKPTSQVWRYYGGRGIKVCERWRESFDNFHDDMGPRPSSGHSIDRIDVNGDYTPENCRWATSDEQGRNKRSNNLIEFNGRTQTISDWSRETGITVSAIFHRIRSGWPLETVFSVPCGEIVNMRRRDELGQFIPLLDKETAQ
jgi:hypothetical protein